MMEKQTFWKPPGTLFPALLGAGCHPAIAGTPGSGIQLRVRSKKGFHFLKKLNIPNRF